MQTTASQLEPVLRPIGWVTSGRPSDARDDPWEGQEAEITIDSEFAGGLEGIEGFSHVWVIWGLSRPGDQSSVLRVHPEGRPELPLVGVFATRSPCRPNPLALTAVRLEAREGARLRVRGLDAFVGTAVFDIKPYLRRGDFWPGALMPEWLESLWKMHDAERTPKCTADQRETNMTDKATIDSLLQEAAKLAPAKVPGLDGVIGLDLGGEGGGQWTLTFKNGALTPAQGVDPGAAATLKMSAVDFEAMCKRQLNPVSAFIGGKLRVVGNMALIMRLQALFQ